MCIQRVAAGSREAEEVQHWVRSGAPAPRGPAAAVGGSNGWVIPLPAEPSFLISIRCKWLKLEHLLPKLMIKCSKSFPESGRRQSGSSVTPKSLQILRTAHQAITASWRQRRSYFPQRRLESKRHF